MSKESAWKKFQKTGSVADYLQYRLEVKNEESIKDNADNY